MINKKSNTIGPTHIPFHWPFDQSKYKAVTRDGEEVKDLGQIIDNGIELLISDEFFVTWCMNGEVIEALDCLDLHLEPINNEL